MRIKEPLPPELNTCLFWPLHTLSPKVKALLIAFVHPSQTRVIPLLPSPQPQRWVLRLLTRPPGAAGWWSSSQGRLWKQVELGLIALSPITRCVTSGKSPSLSFLICLICNMGINNSTYPHRAIGEIKLYLPHKAHSTVWGAQETLNKC